MAGISFINPIRQQAPPRVAGSGYNAADQELKAREAGGHSFAGGAGSTSVPISSSGSPTGVSAQGVSGLQGAEKNQTSTAPSIDHEKGASVFAASHPGAAQGQAVNQLVTMAEDGGEILEFDHALE